MKKIVSNYDELKEFIAPLIVEDKWFIDIRRIKDTEQYTVEWVEHKEYTAQDGQVFRDEVWITKEDVPYFVQDLEPEHAKNIIRMMLRQERQRVEVIDELYKTLEGSGDLILDGLEEQVDNLFPESTRSGSKPPTLH